MELNEYKEVKTNLENELAKIIKDTLKIDLDVTFDGLLESVILEINSKEQNGNDINFSSNKFIFSTDSPNNLKFSGCNQKVFYNNNMVIGNSVGFINTDLQTLLFLNSLLKNFFIEKELMTDPKKEVQEKEEKTS